MHTGVGGCAYRGGGMCIQGWGDVHTGVGGCAFVLAIMHVN